MKLIGKGSFTKAYLLQNGRVRLESTDPVKECMAEGYFPESKLFPTIKKIEWGVYETTYYKPVKSLKNTLTSLHYSYYKALRDIELRYVQNPYDSYMELSKIFKTLPRQLQKNLQYAIDGLSNWGTDIGFEISPRNVAVTKTGKLILLDCFFIKSHLSRSYD